MRKPLNKRNYGRIPHLSNSKLGEKDYFINPGQERILTQARRDRHDTVLVFEKYDGTNVGITKKDGKIIPLSRAGYEATTSLYKQHQLFAAWVKKREDFFQTLLNEGERVVGEWLAQVHGLVYEIEEGVEPIVFFDYFDAKNQRQLFSVLEGLSLPLPRLLHAGNAVQVEALLPKLQQKTPHLKSVEAPEGMVYRVERKGKVDFLAKWVRPDFEAGKYCIGVAEENLRWNIKI